MFEWTLEHATYSNNGTCCPCAIRGGDLNDSGVSNPASNRSVATTSISHYGVGFRVSLY